MARATRQTLSDRPLAVAPPAAAVLAAVLACGVWAAGCARYVLKEADRGVVAVTGPGGRKAADKLMAEHFPGGYEVLREEEVVTGRRTDYHEETDHLGLRLGGGSGVRVEVGGETRGTETVTPTTEYRIHYRRTGSSALAADSPAPPADAVVPAAAEADAD